MFKKIKLSIVITDYITHEYLEELDNSLKDIAVSFEIVHITNDNLGYEFKSTKYFNSYYYPKGDVSGAKNLGLEKARGKYVLMVDNDDYLLNTKQINKLTKDVYFCYYNNCDYLKRQFNGMVVKKKILKKYNLQMLPVSYYEDFIIVDLLYNLANSNYISSKILKQPLYYYRKNPCGICNSNNNEMKITELKKIRNYLKNEKQKEILEKIIKSFEEEKGGE